MQPKDSFSPVIYGPEQHQIDPRMIDVEAINVIERLNQAGFTAYLVGGGVRDLLLRRIPKDFDISTSARPEQIKQIFGRQCLIIGRRFRLAHIRFGHKVLEVSTFRTGDNQEGDLITHDNQWGTPDQDVLRRDFTINGLFYDPTHHSVIDYVNGWADIKTSTLKTIGDAPTRFRQDPVRMMRLLKFRARFGFKIEEETRNALVQSTVEIHKSSPARVLEELLKMMESGAAAPFFHLMSESGLLNELLPNLANFLRGTHGIESYKILTTIDKFHSVMNKPFDRGVLIAGILFPILEQEIDRQFLQKGLTPNIGDVVKLSSDIVRAVLCSSFNHFPKRISSVAIFVMTTQYRLTPLSGRRHPKPKLMRNKEFELAMHLLKIRADVNEKYIEDYVHWKNLYRQVEKKPYIHTRSRHRRVEEVDMESVIDADTEIEVEIESEVEK